MSTGYRPPALVSFSQSASASPRLFKGTVQDHSSPSVVQSGRTSAARKQKSPSATSDTTSNTSALQPDLAASLLLQQQMLDVLSLPKPQLMTFDGDPLNFHVFVNLFDSCVHSANISDAAKLNRLFELCKGKALSVVKSCALYPPSRGYAMARELLISRFGNDFDISERYVRKIVSGPQISPNDISALQQFSDDVRGCAETLTAMGRLEEVDTRSRLVRLVERLPTFLQTRCRKDAVRMRVQYGFYPGIEQFLMFLDEVVVELSDPVFGVKQSTKQDNKKQNSNNKNESKTKSSSFAVAETPAAKTVKPESAPQSSGSVQMTGASSAHQSSSQVQMTGASSAHPSSNPVQMTGVSSASASFPRREIKCVQCDGPHPVYLCDQFKTMTPQKRLQLINDKKCCYNCLKIARHKPDECKVERVCRTDGCNAKHSYLLHEALVGPTGVNSAQPKTNAASATVNVLSESHSQATALAGSEKSEDSHKSVKAALPMVPVQVRSKHTHRVVQTYALLDTGSTNTFCSEKLIQELDITGERVDLSLKTVKDNKDVDAILVSLYVNGMQVGYDKEPYHLDKVFAIKEFPDLMDDLADKKDVQCWEHFNDLPFLDDYALDALLIVGQNKPQLLSTLEVRSQGKNEPIAVRTLLGWSISGPVNKNSAKKAKASNFKISLDESVERFWKIDGLCITDEQMPSVNDNAVIKLWDETTQLENQHYVMRIPFKQEDPDLPDNRVLAEKRLSYLGRRLKKDKVLCERYKSEIDKLVDKGFAEKVRDSCASVQGKTWYIPHHSVINPNKPEKLRVVNDCSAKFDGASLNTAVHRGPDLTNKLVGVLLRFRQKQYAIMSDVEAMYHQVVVPKEQRSVLRFLWWADGVPDQQTEIYQMTRHLFGGIWSASASNYALKRTAKDNAADFDSEAVEAVIRSFYVDDLLHSVESEERGIYVAHQIQDLLSKGGFTLNKWVSSSKKILESVPVERRSKSVQNLDLDQDDLPIERALGLVWHCDDDMFRVSVKQKEAVLTRRGLLSYLSSVYDPVGFVCPFVLIAKLLFQHETRLRKSWDAPLEHGHATGFLKWVELLPQLRDISIPRCMLPPVNEDVRIELHHFADASSEAYGTASYIRSINSEGIVSVSFIFGKSRLAPIKPVTIPRLELMAAVIAVNVDCMLRKELTVPLCQSYFWTDSTCVLAYIKNVESRFSVFVANRLAAIHQHTSSDQWRYVPTTLNPADDASRGIKPLELSRWFEGPKFLLENESEWPDDPQTLQISETDPDVKQPTSVMAVASDLATSSASSDHVMTSLFSRYSSWYRLKRAVVWIQQFIMWLKSKKKAEVRMITPADMEMAELSIIRQVQKLTLPSYSDILHGVVARSNRLFKLEPFADHNGLIRVGGRLKYAPLSDEAKNQVLLMPDSHVTKLIVRGAHIMSKHSGTEYVLATLRQRYWVVKGRSVIKSVIRACVMCKRLYSVPQNQRMADLPPDRLAAGQAPFTNVGVDVFGPFLVKRGRSQEKRYGLIFTCLVIRAVHIEVLSSLDSDAFINAVFRFCSRRRSRPAIIRCDNGTNFVGGSRELLASIDNWNKNVSQNLLQRNIKFIFNPPGASHMGGVWERLIRSTRRVLNAVLHNVVLDDERLATALCEVESIINCRPITHVSSDPGDAPPLTPNDLLQPGGSAHLPPGIFSIRDIYTRRWRHVQHLADQFWSRWAREYISTVQHRQKWIKPITDFAVNDIVLVADENTPRNRWPIGRIVEVNKGRDHLVRSAVVKTQLTTLKRPVAKLCYLESHVE